MAIGTEFTHDFFVSRRGGAAAIATDVAAVLEREGYSVKIQDHDFARGGNFVADIHAALLGARHLFVLHTEDYDKSPWTLAEFTNFLACVPESQGTRRICMLRCDASFPGGILKSTVFGDYFGVSDPEARRQTILAIARGEAMSARREPPLFGGSIPKKNAHFTGRQRVLDEVTMLTRGEIGSSELRVVAICGLAGTGKTSIARACVDALAPDYPGVWWINAQTRQNLLAGLAALGARLDPMLRHEADVEKGARAAIARIERFERPFLLVFDNVDHPADIHDLLPARGAHVLVTSRRSDWHGTAHEVAIDGMDDIEATAFLQARSGRRDEAGARRLAGLLGYLPLALDHAGAYVRLSMSTFDAYAKGIDRLLAKAPKDAPYPASVAATFSLAIETAIQDCAGADVVLGQLAFFAPERIPLDLLPESPSPDEDRGDAIMALAEVSLIRSDPLDEDCPGVSVHRLVQAAARIRLAARGDATHMLEAAIVSLKAAFPLGGHEDPAVWPRCGQLLSHAMALREHMATHKLLTPAAPVLFEHVGHYLHGRAMYRQAEAVFRDAIGLSETAFGAEALEVARSKNDLASVLRALGRHREAEPLLREALAVQEAKLGRGDNGCARTMTSLGWLLHELGQSAEAEDLTREAIAGGKATLGHDHPEIAVRLNNLALLMQHAGRVDDAEALFRESIATGVKSQGRAHPMVLTRLSNLASLLLAKGQGGEAEILFAEAIDGGIRSLGPDHPDLAAWRNNLANLYRDQKRYAEATPLYREAIATCLKVHGAAHSLTGRIQRNFAVLQLATGDLEEALRNAKDALAVHDPMLGRTHPWTLDSARCYADALERLERAAEAHIARATYELKAADTAGLTA